MSGKKVRDANPRQIIQDAQRTLLQMDTPEAQAVLRDVQMLAGVIQSLQEAIIVALERECVAQANRAIAEREVSRWKADGMQKGRDYLAGVIGRGLDMDPAMIDVVLKWIEGDLPADVPPFFINQLREAFREVRDIVTYERGEDAS
jgi:hypothetical protein